MKYKLRNLKRNKIKETKDLGRKKYLFGFLLLAFVSISVLVTIQGVTSGNELTELENEAIEINKQNHKLSQQLIEYSSLYDKSKEAQLLGFEKPENIVYIGGEVAVASLR